MEFGAGVVPRGKISQNHTVEYRKVGSNKIADEETCGVGPPDGALW
jgi:hypothetical protein